MNHPWRHRLHLFSGHHGYLATLSVIAVSLVLSSEWRNAGERNNGILHKTFFDFVQYIFPSRVLRGWHPRLQPPAQRHVLAHHEVAHGLLRREVRGGSAHEVRKMLFLFIEKAVLWRLDLAGFPATLA